jgi:hypothetical protein
MNRPDPDPDPDPIRHPADHRALDRRALLRGSCRWAGLAALGGLAAWLGHRSLDRECTRAGPCGGCPQFSGCGLPKAKSAQQSGGRASYPAAPGDA